MRKIGWLLLVVMTLLGCSKKNPTIVTVTPTKFVVAEIAVNGFTYAQYGETISVYSDSALDLGQSWAELRFGTTQYGLFRKAPFPGGFCITDTLHLPGPGTLCSLVVTTDLGSGRAGGVSVPGEFQFYGPPLWDTLPWDGARVDWSNARNATWYDLLVHCSVYDTMWQPLASADTVLLITGTFALIPKSFLQRDPAALYAIVSVNLCPHDGAFPGWGTTGRFSGDFKGYFYSTYSNRNNYRYFYVGTPRFVQKMDLPPPPFSAGKRRQAILRAFGVHVE